MPKGTIVTTEPVNGEACRYRLCWDTTLLPMRIAAAAMGGLPLDAPALGLAQAKGVLRLSLAATNPDVELATIGLDTLRLFIRADARRAQILIEQLGVNLLGIGVGTGPEDPRGGAAAAVGAAADGARARRTAAAADAGRLDRLRRDAGAFLLSAEAPVRRGDAGWRRAR